MISQGGVEDVTLIAGTLATVLESTRSGNTSRALILNVSLVGVDRDVLIIYHDVLAVNMSNRVQLV